MDIAQIQAMHAYIQQLNFQTASAVASTTPNLLASTNPLLNSALINPPPPTSVNDSSLNPLALAFLYAKQHHQQNSSNTQVQQQQQQQPQIHSQQIPVPPTTTMPPLNFQAQQPQVATPQQQIYNPNNIQISDIQKQIEQQAILNQLSHLISSLGQSQIPPPPQIGSIYNPLPQQFHQQQHQSAMSKPPILTPSQPIQIPKPHHQQQHQLRQSLPTSTPESNRKRRHRDVEIISSQSSSQSSSPNNNNNNINASRSRAFTCPETMKEQKQQPSQKDQSDHPSSSPDKIAKFDPSCPRRHHPDNVSTLAKGIIFLIILTL
jgi:hypothetical protein